MSDNLYFVVESGPALAICQDWKDRYIASRAAIVEFARAKGAISVRFGFEGELFALSPVSPVPPGWRVYRVKRGRDDMRPDKGDKGAPARAEIDALPPVPRRAELMQALKITGQVSWTAGESRGFYCVGGLFPVQLVWEDEILVLIVGDPAPIIASVRCDCPDAIINGEWIAPPGLRKITEAEYNLLSAEAAVKRERAALLRAMAAKDPSDAP